MPFYILYESWISTDFRICKGSWNQSPTDATVLVLPITKRTQWGRYHFTGEEAWPQTKWLSQGRTPSKCQRWDLDPGSLTGVHNFNCYTILPPEWSVTKFLPSVFDNCYLFCTRHYYYSILFSQTTFSLRLLYLHILCLWLRPSFQLSHFSICLLNKPLFIFPCPAQSSSLL